MGWLESKKFHYFLSAQAVIGSTMFRCQQSVVLIHSLCGRKRFVTFVPRRDDWDPRDWDHTFWVGDRIVWTPIIASAEQKVP